MEEYVDEWFVDIYLAIKASGHPLNKSISWSKASGKSATANLDHVTSKRESAEIILYRYSHSYIESEFVYYQA